MSNNVEEEMFLTQAELEQLLKDLPKILKELEQQLQSIKGKG
jgi:hypothetical protein